MQTTRTHAGPEPQTAPQDGRVDQVPRNTLDSACRYRDPHDAFTHLGWKANADGDWIHVNPRWLEYTGCSPSQSLGADWLGHVHPEDHDAVQNAWVWANAMETRFECECRLLRHDGAFRWFLMRGLPVVNAGQQLTGWIGTCTDVHALKTAMLELQRLVADRHAGTFNPEAKSSGSRFAS